MLQCAQRVIKLCLVSKLIITLTIIISSLPTSGHNEMLFGFFLRFALTHIRDERVRDVDEGEEEEKFCVS